MIEPRNTQPLLFIVRGVACEVGFGLKLRSLMELVGLLLMECLRSEVAGTQRFGGTQLIHCHWLTKTHTKKEESRL